MRQIFVKLVTTQTQEKKCRWISKTKNPTNLGVFIKGDLDTSFWNWKEFKPTWNQSSSWIPLQSSQCFDWFLVFYWKTCFWVCFCSSYNVVFIIFGYLVAMKWYLMRMCASWLWSFKELAPGKLIDCEDDFACQVWRYRRKIFLWWSSVQNVLHTCETSYPTGNEIPAS